MPSLLPEAKRTRGRKGGERTNDIRPHLSWNIGARSMFFRSRARRCAGSAANQNLTSMTNMFRSAESLVKRGPNGSVMGASTHGAVPRKNREDMKKITLLHETEECIVAGRNQCNNFRSNQYCVVSKKSNEAVMIDASDDWMDDWIAFLNSSGARLKCIFFTHLHVDNIINLSPLVSMVGESRGGRVGDDIRAAERNVSFAFNPGDRVWLEYFRASCIKYGRTDMAKVPMEALFFPLQPQKDTLLSGSTSRSDSFIALGDLLLFFVATPGHSQGHMVLHMPLEKVLFTGDLIFWNGVGRVDLPYGAADLMAQSLRMLEDFPDNTILLPGHGKISALGRERQKNLGLRRVYELLAAGHKCPRVGDNDGYI